MFLEDRQTNQSVATPPSSAGGIYTLGLGYHSAPDADFMAKVHKSAKLQDFGYHVKGALLKQSHSPIHSSYKKSTKCGKVVNIQSRDGKTEQKFDYLCRQRWCPRCNRIRAAELITAYVPIITTWQGLYMVTLTQRNVDPYHLREKLDEMQKRFRNIFRTMHRHLGTVDIKAIKTIEVSANLKTRTLHPHYHVLVERYDAAMLLRDLWMKRAKRDGDAVVWKAQEVNLIQKPDVAAKELFKYLTKYLVREEGETAFNGWLLDKIYVGTRRKHLVQSFGFEKPELENETEEEELRPSVDDDGRPTFQSFPIVWKPKVHQYMVTATGELYTNHRRSRAFAKILKIIKGRPPT